MGQDSSSGAKRASKDDDEAEVIIEDAGKKQKKSALKQAQESTRSNQDEHVTIEHTVTPDDFKRK